MDKGDIYPVYQGLWTQGTNSTSSSLVAYGSGASAATKEWLANPMGYNDTQYRKGARGRHRSTGSSLNRRGFGGRR